jgi:hypothetical protein
MTPMTAASVEGSADELTRLLARLEASPFLRIEQRGARGALYFGGQAQAVGVLDVRTGMLTVDVDREFIGGLRERHPQWQPTAGGVRLRANGVGLASAEALIRWRIDLERFAPQQRDAAP